MKLKLDDLAKAFAKSDVHQGYIDIVNGKVILLANGLSEEKSLDHIFDIEDDWEHYIPLPNVIDTQEHSIMKTFAEAQENSEIKVRLLTVLAKPGASKHFLEQVQRLLLKKAWQAYKHEQLKQIAREFCEENALEYEAN